MSFNQVFEHSIVIKACERIVERCFTEQDLMHRWLNPLLRCDPIGEWNTNIGAKSRFLIKIPLIKPTLESVVIERQSGLVVWQFEGFFQGCDRWQCEATDQGTILTNRFEFTIPNPLVSWGFKYFAASLTKKDQEAQLKRLKQVAEAIAKESPE
jgi:hypothetical protein